MKREQQITLSLIAAGFLLFCVVDGLPYGYFTFLRFIVFIISGFFVIKLFNMESNQIWVWTFGLIAILFNPLIPIYLQRSQWVIIDVLVGIFFLISIPLLKKILNAN